MLTTMYIQKDEQVTAVIPDTDRLLLALPALIKK